MTILIVAGSAEERHKLKTGLDLQNYATEAVKTGEEALEKASVNDYDIIILDSPLAAEIVKRLRQMEVAAGIIVLTPAKRGTEAVEVLEAGADDCLAKPFMQAELSARIRALLRRERSVKPTQLRVGDLILDPGSHTVWRAGREIYLTKKEYRLLDYLMRRPGYVCTRNMIGERVWGYDFDSKSNVIDVYIGYLRRKIDRGFQPKLIHTIRDVGYKIEDKSRQPNLIQTKTARSPKSGLPFLYDD